MKPINESSSPGPDADQTVSWHLSSARPPETLHGEPRLPLKTPEPAASILADPLLAAATPLLRLLGLLASNFRPPDVPLLRERAGQEISLFEKKCRDQGVPMELLRPSHYALCAALDDVVLNSPWGAGSVWSDRPLARTRYRELHNETQFFAMLDELRREPAKFLSALELFYFCLSFGFQGQYRRDLQGLNLLRGELSTLIVRQREVVQTEPATTVARLMLRAGTVPAWIPLLGALALAGASYMGVSYELNRASKNLYLDAVNSPPAQMPAFVRLHPQR